MYDFGSFMELLERIEYDIIPIFQFRNVLEMVVLYVQPTKRNYVASRGEGLEGMKLRRIVLKNVLQHARKEMFCFSEEKY